MKVRLTALDGLRGFAALTVVLGHLNDNYKFISGANPLFQQMYYIFSSGGEGVLIFFVLSGFLISSIYSKISNPLAFIQKRYTRIFPIFLVVTTYLWTSNLFFKNHFIRLPLLVIIALFTRFIWKYFKKRNDSVKRIFLFTFLGLQTFMIFIALITLGHLNKAPKALSFLNYLTNLTLTFSFFQDAIKLENVFWSLFPEIVFYLLYPIFIIKIINFLKKSHKSCSVFVIIFSSFFLIGLGLLLPSFYLGHATGFIAGVTIGTLYNSSSAFSKKIIEKFKSKELNWFVLFLSIFTLSGFVNMPNLNRFIYSNSGYFLLFYLCFSGWVFAALVLTILTPNTLLNKIFSNKLLAFFGTISYSMYLIHSEAIRRSHIFFSYLSNYINFPNKEIVSIFVSLGTTIFVSFILFRLVESLYFKKN